VSATARPARWWELPWDEQTHVTQGTLAYVQGTTQTITCPQCGQRPVVYNGNYFCDGYAPLEGGDPGTCDWALAHPATTRRDREVCDLIGIDHL
jgi:hypothetical protein